MYDIKTINRFEWMIIVDIRVLHCHLLYHQISRCVNYMAHFPLCHQQCIFDVLTFLLSYSRIELFIVKLSMEQIHHIQINVSNGRFNSNNKRYIQFSFYTEPKNSVYNTVHHVVIVYSKLGTLDLQERWNVEHSFYRVTCVINNDYSHKQSLEFLWILAMITKNKGSLRCLAINEQVVILVLEMIH